jgi:hypothetical protein
MQKKNIAKREARNTPPPLPLRKTLPFHELSQVDTVGLLLAWLPRDVAELVEATTTCFVIDVLITILFKN